MGTTEIRRQARPIQHDVEDDDSLYITRMPSSTRRYRTAPPPVAADTLEGPITEERMFIQHRRSSLKRPHTSGMASNAVKPPKTDELPGRRRFSLLAIGMGMVVMVLIVICLSAWNAWWHTYQDDQQFGRPRTFQMDAVVGHEDSPSNPTHFIFINLHRHVEIIEIPGGNVAHTHIYSGPILFGDGQDLTPVTGEIRDINGRRDLVVHIQDQQIVFINDGSTFRPQ